MQPPRPLHNLRPRLQHQMIRIAKHQLLARFVGIPKIHPLQRRIRRDGDVRGRVDDAVRSVDASDAGQAFFGFVEYFEPEEVARVVGGWREG